MASKWGFLCGEAGLRSPEIGDCVKKPGERGFRFDWERKVAACRLGATTKAVALMLAMNGNSEGTTPHPGVRLLAHQTELGESTVRRCLEQLRDLGLIIRTKRGSTSAVRNYADCYELAMPDDLEERVVVQKEPAPVPGCRGRGGRANHVRWHESRDIIDPKCLHCTEAKERAESGFPPEADFPSIIRPPLGRTPSSARTDTDHRSVEEHYQGFTTKEKSHHSARSLAAARASSRGRAEGYNAFFDDAWNEMVSQGEELAQEDHEYVCDTINQRYVEEQLGDLDVHEESTVNGMLDSGAHPSAVVNKIRSMRGEAA